MIIGVSGKIGHGKDVIASYLKREHNFKIIRMSDSIKEEVLARMPRTLRAIIELGGEALNHPGLREYVYNIKPKGIRELLQEYGTEVRRWDDPDYWVKRWAEAAQKARVDDPGVRIVTPDIRYPNEVKAVREVGGQVWRVFRPGFDTGTHASETALDGYTQWDAYFRNDQDIPWLEARVRDWLLDA